MDLSLQLCALRPRAGAEAGTEGGAAWAGGCFLPGGQRGVPPPRELECCSRAKALRGPKRPQGHRGQGGGGGGGWEQTRLGVKPGKWKPAVPTTGPGRHERSSHAPAGSPRSHTLGRLSGFVCAGGLALYFLKHTSLPVAGSWASFNLPSSPTREGWGPTPFHS